jgi:tryptophan synthase beta chain
MLNYAQPDARGHFGPVNGTYFGGTFVAETLIHALHELDATYAKYRDDAEFQREFRYELKHFVGRPSPIYHAARTSRELGGAQIYLKREDLNHTGAHKVNNTIGQALLARRMGKKRVIAETGAGQHGVATATICARYGIECVVYMGSEDIKRQSPNVYRMHLLGATVVPVESGSKTLKDALNEALRDWVTNVENTFYIIGTVAGPHPYPMMVRDFQSVIGDECLVQMPEQIGIPGAQPDAVIACVGGGSNAMGMFYPYIRHEGTRLIGVEAAGLGLDSGKHSASLSAGSPGVLHGNRTYLLQDENGQITETHSISAGLDYPGVGPEHAYLKDIGRAEYVGITDDEALKAFHHLCRTEGIIPALESSHAMAYAMKLAPSMRSDQHILVNLSGRGDKDIGTVADLSGAEFFCRPSCRGQSVKTGVQGVSGLQTVQTVQVQR